MDHQDSPSKPPSQPTKVVLAPPKVDEPERSTVTDLPWWETVRGRSFSSFFLSGLFHLTLLVCLALVYFYQPVEGVPGLTVWVDDAVRLETTQTTKPQPEEAVRDWQEGEVFLAAPEAIVPETESGGKVETRPTPSSWAPLGIDRGELARRVESGGKGRLAGRSRENRDRLVRQRGGNGGSEAAVERGLRWLAAQQDDDGGWSLVPDPKSNRPPYANPGKLPRRQSATGLALLPFLGAGYTHQSGPYKELVDRGIYFLLSHSNTEAGRGISLLEDPIKPMYAQGIGTLAVCEAYAMTDDPALRSFAQGLVDFIVFAQDKKRGGWRYYPGELGDTTVTGWQMMALKSAEAAGLNVPSEALRGASRFLDSVQSDGGAKYGYMDTRPRPATTAIGLLCRMYTGWSRSHTGLKRGVKTLSKWSPSATDLYYNYYATQVLSHWEGAPWKRWNETMRDYLIKTQSSERLEAGSWYFPDPNGDVGGRLYNTAMAVMILEIYYRYLPIYKTKSLVVE